MSTPELALNYISKNTGNPAHCSSRVSASLLSGFFGVSDQGKVAQFINLLRKKALPGQLWRGPKVGQLTT